MAASQPIKLEKAGLLCEMLPYNYWLSRGAAKTWVELTEVSTSTPGLRV